MKRVRAAIEEMEYGNLTSIEVAEELKIRHPELFPHSIDHTAKFVANIQRDMGKESTHLQPVRPRKIQPRKGVLITKGK